jgi:Ca2+:H+ antiporter
MWPAAAAAVGSCAVRSGGRHLSTTHSLQHISWWTWAAPLGAMALVGLKYAHLVDPTSGPVIALAAALLLGAVFAAVHHAEVLAVKLGEPFGSILLAVAVTVIEVGLIVSVMLTASTPNMALARDTVYSAVLIVLNGVVGLCLLTGGARYGEQVFKTKATTSMLGVLTTLAVLTMVLPNFTLAKLGPQYSPTQLIFVGVLSLILYGVFIFVQSVRHREYFLPETSAAVAEAATEVEPSARVTAVSALFLPLSLTGVVLLAKTLSPALEQVIARAGLPASFIGVIIAALVLLPEGLASVISARANRLHTSLNLALGSAIASIGLTIPVVGAVSLYLKQELIIGLAGEEMALLLLTLFVSSITLQTGRATILQGVVHLVIFGVFLLLAAVP